MVTARETEDTSDTASGDDVGMTATAFLSVSLEPPLVLVSLRRQARMREVLDTQPDVPHRPGSLTGAPLVGGALATLECRTHQVVEAGDHSLVLGEVLAANLPSPEGLPLLHFRGRYRALG
ncbi:MAG: flavin reductase family protein [Streptomycetaceae bacterium]|nr:flavin reductase family protein [Streptomycetaceae bacterium]